MNIDDLKKWPIEGKIAREKPVKLFHITKDKILHTISGTKHPIHLSFYVSNDLINMGEFEIPSGGEGVRASEPDIHKGDEAFYVLIGPIMVFLPDTQESFEVLEGECMFIPEGIKHQYLNYTDKVVKAVFAVAPDL